MDVKKLKKYYDELKKEFADEEIYPADLIKIAKDFIIHENIHEEKKAEQNGQKKYTIKNPNAPATDKQMAYLLNLGYSGNTDGLTQGEVSQLIDEYKKKQENSAGYDNY